MRPSLKLLGLACLLAGSCTNPHKDKVNGTSMETGRDWPVYGGNKAGNRYSPLTQIDLNNVKSLQVAWTYDPVVFSIRMRMRMPGCFK